MRVRIAFTIVFVVAAAAASRAAAGVSVVSTVSDLRLESVQPETDAGLSICLKDPAAASRVRFDTTTGQYVFCGSDGTHEQGTGVVTQNGTVWTLSHMIDFDAGSFETIRATADTASHQGHVDLKSSDENRSSFTRFSFTDSNFPANTDCSSCPLLTAPAEGAINLSSGALQNLIGGNPSKSDFVLLQSFTLNSNFSGKLTDYSALLAQNGTAPADVTYQFVVTGAVAGKPGTVIYQGPPVTLRNISPLPAVHVVHGDLNITPGSNFFVGIRINPSKSNIFVPTDISPTAPDTGVYICDSIATSTCQSLTSFSSYANVRNLYFSLNGSYPTVLGSAGMVRYGDGLSTNIISSKSRSCYTQLDLKPAVLELLDARGGAAGSPVTDYSNAWARITRIDVGASTGLDGFAETMYSMMKFSAFSYSTGQNLNFCTRPEGVTDFVCRTVPGYQPGTCNYTRLLALKAGFEQSCGNFQADVIDRWQWNFGPTAWQSQTLAPVTATPAIVNPDFGGIWYGAGSWKLGTVYNFKKIDGEIESQSFNGNQLLHKLSLGTDIPPPGFLPSEASIMAADCGREGWCVFGRYSTVSGKNLADYIDFSQATPEIKTIDIGPGVKGLNFGRAVSVYGRDETALYASYTPSAIANQFRIQYDYFKLDTSLRYTLSHEYGFGLGHYPLAISRAEGDYGVTHARGVSVFQDLQSGCDLSRIRMRPNGSGSGSSEPAPIPMPCENLPSISGRAHH